jgi:hypothetical protein
MIERGLLGRVVSDLAVFIKKVVGRGRSVEVIASEVELRWRG